MASKSYTLLEYLVTIEMELKKLKKIVAESVGTDYNELISQINGIGQELNSFKSSITDTVNTNNSNLTSKFNSLEQQFNTFKTSITNTVNSNNTTLTSQLITLTTQFNQFKTSIESQVSSLNTRVTSVENRVSSLENSGGSGGSGGSVNINDNTISNNSTWSSEKIEDFVFNNSGVIWSEVEGENLSINYSKEGYLRDIEILGTTLRDVDSINLFDGQLKQGDLSSSDGSETTSSSRISSVNFIVTNGVNTLYVYREKANGNFAFRCYNSEKTFIASTSADRTNRTFSSTLPSGTKFVKFIDETNDLTNRYTIAIEPVTEYIEYHKGTNEILGNLGEISDNGQYKIDIISAKEETYDVDNSYKSSILLPCQLTNESGSPDRLYWDNNKNKYVVEKATTNEIIETNITEQIKIPCYINNTYLFVTGGINGIIKCKSPIDVAQAIQSLTEENYTIRNDVSTLSLENEELKEVNNIQDILIDTTMLATDELYTMVEPILEAIPQTLTLERSTSKMVDMYVCMIQRGLKTIEQIPTRYREEVRRILEELEK